MAAFESTRRFDKISTGGILLLDQERKRRFDKLAQLVSKPSVAAANARMDAELKTSPGSYNAEDVENFRGPVIAMNVALVEMGDDNEDEVYPSSDETSSEEEERRKSMHGIEDDCESDDDMNSLNTNNLKLKKEANKSTTSMKSKITVLEDIENNSELDCILQNDVVSSSTEQCSKTTQ